MKSIRTLISLCLLAAGVVAPAHAADPCRMLVLGAMPVEIGPLLDHATIADRIDIPTTDGARFKSFFVGSLEGNDVILAMTGIGTVNAAETTQLAFANLGCIDGVVFSGVSGGDSREWIGDVFAPKTWELHLFDESGHVTSSHYSADDRMLVAANIAKESVSLSPDGRLGDCGCVGIDPEQTPAIHFDHAPTISIGGSLSGLTSDPFGGHPLPCLPGTDTFGCQPCKHISPVLIDPLGTAKTTQPFLTPEFFSWYQTWSSGSADVDVKDMESAAVASVAAGRAPFIAFRSPSDGANGDPLPTIPGPLAFVPQFLAYRQYAADNAATMTRAFLAEWHAENG